MELTNQVILKEQEKLISEEDQENKLIQLSSLSEQKLHKEHLKIQQLQSQLNQLSKS